LSIEYILHKNDRLDIIIEGGNISELELKIFLETQIFLVGEVKI